MTELKDLHAFDISNSQVSVWVFKGSTVAGEIKLNGKWIAISSDLASEFKLAVRKNIDEITETIEYDILAQNNEGSAMTIMADETHAHLIYEQIADQKKSKMVQSIKHLNNTKFCVVKFVWQKQIMLAVRKTDSSWSTKKSTDLIRMIYSNDELDVDKDPSFSIRPYFDFYMLNDIIFVKNKPKFEVALSYKGGHEEKFEELKAETEFSAIFSDVGPLSDFVNSNRMHLRRAIAIQQKGHYKNPVFMELLKKECKSMNLNIDFGKDGKIIPSLQTCRDIFQALLDHRLHSRLTAIMYDVPSAQQV